MQQFGCSEPTSLHLYSTRQNKKKKKQKYCLTYFLLLWFQTKAERTTASRLNQTYTVSPPLCSLGVILFPPNNQSSISIFFFFFFPAVPKPGEGEGSVDNPTPCPEDYAQFCEHGQCEMRQNLPTCRCVLNPAYSDN